MSDHWRIIEGAALSSNHRADLIVATDNVAYEFDVAGTNAYLQSAYELREPINSESGLDVTELSRTPDLPEAAKEKVENEGYYVF